MKTKIPQKQFKITKMKNFLVIIVMALLPLVGFSQSIFDKYEDLDDVSAVVISKSMFNLLSKMDIDVDDQENQEYIDMVQTLTGLKVFITESPKVSADMKGEVTKYLKSEKMEELMRIKDKDANVKFYIRNGDDEDHVSELLMFVTGMKNVDVEVNGRKFETVLLSLTGDIDLNKIGTLTRKMNLPEELNKAGKKQ